MSISSLCSKFRDYLLLTLLRFIAKSASRPPPCAFRTFTEIPSRDPTRTIKAHIYTPPILCHSNAPSAVIINWHAGGFILPVHGQDAKFCASMAEDVGCVVIDADYRKAPEDAFPAAVEDVEDVVRWVLGRREVYDIGRIAVTGFSSGGTLALGVCLRTQSAAGGGFGLDMGLTIPRAVVTFYPPTDKSIPPEAKTAVGDLVDPTPPFILELFGKAYPGVTADLANPLISPSRADLTRFSDSDYLILTCAGDLLCAEAEELGHRLEQRATEDHRGRKVLVKRLEGVGHAWDKKARDGTREAEVRDEAYVLAAEFLKESLSRL
ncbi:Alpha/Beta hydrolase protein [Fimicolochytrium jonesii]|uniref:Alpha/Beta hydrolase protein n=1 Tax=Fimicolochytrium jonesii TaxID=1396493 RepID=UPI0022FE9709|nr:Alpha/Beta hydrolase protein [Fimicolochytrium jonesii]KAI8816556.1 Alpha/Beta hydrolase protein [Fimicolochytrium jonesii]